MIAIAIRIASSLIAIFRNGVCWWHLCYCFSAALAAVIATTATAAAHVHSHAKGCLLRSQKEWSEEEVDYNTAPLPSITQHHLHMSAFYM